MMGVMKIMVTASLMFQVSEGETCLDVTAASTGAANKLCWEGMKWAKGTGIKTKTEWYTAHYPNLTADSAYSVFQCMLHRKSHNGENDGGAEGHNCTRPCASNVSECMDIPASASAPAPGTQSTPPVVVAAAAGGGMPGYAWVLIVLGVCCGLPCLGMCCSAFLCYEAVAFILDPICGGKKGAQKKKRAVKKPTEAAPAPVALAAPVVTTSLPMPMYHQVMQAAPVYVEHHEAPAMTYHPSSMSYAAPMAYAPASMSYAAHPAYAAPAEYAYAAHPGSVTYSAAQPHYAVAAEPVHAFALDQNHDGVITHQEFGAAMR